MEVINTEEVAYLNILENVLKNGDYRLDRTKTGIYSIFGQNLKFSLRNGQIPLLTTKRVYWRGVVEELIFFLKGMTNNVYLQDKKVRIWDGNSSREYLDSIGLTEREVGDLGPVYGWNWRHFGANYKDCHTDYSNQGVDQIKNAINLIKNEPTSRRIIVTSWDPTKLNEVCLPACHVMFQFYVNVEKGELSCQMYQRSVDCFLGLPFNISSYALLTYIIADICGLKPGELTMCLGDTHIYKNHVEQCKIQMSRNPNKFPKLNIKNHHENPEDYEFDDFEILDYKPGPIIKADMAI